MSFDSDTHKKHTSLEWFIPLYTAVTNNDDQISVTAEDDVTLTLSI